MKDLIIGVIIVFILFSVFLLGAKSKQLQIENRAKTIKTETITQQQLEYIIFNEIQE